MPRVMINVNDIHVVCRLRLLCDYGWYKKDYATKVSGCSEDRKVWKSKLAGVGMVRIQYTVRETADTFQLLSNTCIVIQEAGNSKGGEDNRAQTRDYRQDKK